MNKLMIVGWFIVVAVVGVLLGVVLASGDDDGLSFAVPTVVPTTVPTAVLTAVPTAVLTAVPTAVPTAVYGPETPFNDIRDLVARRYINCQRSKGGALADAERMEVAFEAYLNTFPVFLQVHEEYWWVVMYRTDPQKDSEEHLREAEEIGLLLEQYEVLLKQYELDLANLERVFKELGC